MLSYQHIYHAGNFADVQKHALLAQVIRSLTAKPGPLTVIDTHAGRGLYALDSAEAQKNREFDNGITRQWPPPADTGMLKPLLDIVAQLNDETLGRYPGSALIARKLLRPSDRLAAVERHPGEIRHLQESLAGYPATEVVHGDGLAELEKRLPKPPARLLAVIDPSYEIKTDYTDVARCILRVAKKSPPACLFLWYPVMQAGGHIDMLSLLRREGLANALACETILPQPPEAEYRMFGSGIMIVNPPWPESVAQQVNTATSHPEATAETFWLENCAADDSDRIIRPAPRQPT